MIDLILHCLICAVPLGIVFFRDKIKIKDFLLLFLIVLIGLIFSFFSIIYYGQKQAASGNNIDVGSLIIIAFTGFIYILVLPLIFIFKRKRQ